MHFMLYLFIHLFFARLDVNVLLFSNSVRNQAENDQITNLIQPRHQGVWIGLYRSLWSDGSFSLFQHWAAVQPDNVTDKCAATEMNILGEWFNVDCTLSLPFVCHTRGNVSNLIFHIRLSNIKKYISLLNTKKLWLKKKSLNLYTGSSY